MIEPYNPINKITMKNMATVSQKVYNAQNNIMNSVPVKYQYLVTMYGELALAQHKIELSLDANEVLSFEDWHAIKELSTSATEEASTTKPIISKELKETVADLWSMLKSDKNDEMKEVWK